MSNDSPREVGAMLLSGIPLLPNNAVPLHIFEPRYRKMLEDAMEGDHQFAIGRLTQEEGEDLSSCVAETGILAKVVVLQKLPDGRSLVIIKGEHPIKFTHWNSTLPYPIAEFEEVKRVVMSDTEPVRKLLKESFLSSISDESEENKVKIIEALDSFEELTALIDFIAHYSIHNEQKRPFYLNEVSDSKRASQLLLELERESD